MGNSQPKNLDSEFQKHDRLGQVRIAEYEDKQLDEIISTMQIDKFVQNERIIDNWKTQIIRIDDTQAKQILLLPQKFTFEKGGMCGSSGTVKILYENLSFVLKGQIQNRFKNNKYFEERQIWYLLYNMIRAGNKFERIKKKIGNIHPNNILINDAGQIKIIASCSIPGQPDNFQAKTENHNAQAFLAPQQLVNDAVINAKYPSNINPCLAQVFSIGLTILSAGTLLDCDNIYQNKKNSIKINQNAIQDLLKYFKQKYSSFLSDIVTDMVALNPNNRKHSSDIYQMLYQYENEILDLQPFAPPERYIGTQQSINQSNYYPTNHFQPPTINSNTFSSMVHPQPYQVRKIVNPAQMNHVHESYMEKSNMPVHVMTNSQIPRQQIMGYSSQFQPSNQFGQQSGIPIQRQSFVPSGSTILQGSMMPQTHFSNIHNVNVAQSNYIPNYQFRA